MDSPYRDDPYSSPGENAPPTSIGTDAPSADATGGGNGETGGAPPPMPQQSQERPQQQQQQQNYPPQQHQSRNERFGGNGRRGRRGRGRGGPRQDHQQHQQQQQQYSGPPVPIVADGATAGWFDTNRDAGYIRRAANSYLPDPADAFVPPHLVRQFALRRGDLIEATTGHDHRGRTVTAEVTTVNGGDPALALKRAEFGALIASYPDRRLTLETGRPAKGGPELTRRAIDLIAPIGYGQRALIVAPARAGKTMLLQAITEGVAINHPQAVLLVLLVDERPEEVSEMISWGRGEVIASSFDMPAERHTEVTEMVLERARRLVEGGTDVVIVLDSLTRMARAYNTVERGTGRTLSGGLDATAMAKP